MIGILDSGSGGLTVLRAIRKRFPSVDVVYYGDIANVPYGSKSQDELFALTARAIRFLREQGAERTVSACNSVSASLAISLFDAFSIGHLDLIEMIGPTVSMFKDSNARVLLCATSATVRANLYGNGFDLIGKTVQQIPIPDLASAIERNDSNDVLEGIIRDAFAEVDVSAYDALVLACTHYPLVAHVFRRVLGERIELIDPAEAVAARVESRWWPREIGEGKTHFFITKESDAFRNRVASLFPGYAEHIACIPVDASHAHVRNHALVSARKE